MKKKDFICAINNKKHEHIHFEKILNKKEADIHTLAGMSKVFLLFLDKLKLQLVTLG